MFLYSSKNDNVTPNSICDFTFHFFALLFFKVASDLDICWFCLMQFEILIFWGKYDDRLQYFKKKKKKVWIPFPGDLQSSNSGCWFVSSLLFVSSSFLRDCFLHSISSFFFFFFLKLPTLASYFFIGFASPNNQTNHIFYLPLLFLSLHLRLHCQQLDLLLHIFIYFLVRSHCSFPFRDFLPPFAFLDIPFQLHQKMQGDSFSLFFLNFLFLFALILFFKISLHWASTFCWWDPFLFSPLSLNRQAESPANQVFSFEYFLFFFPLPFQIGINFVKVFFLSSWLSSIFPFFPFFHQRSWCAIYPSFEDLCCTSMRKPMDVINRNNVIEVPFPFLLFLFFFFCWFPSSESTIIWYRLIFFLPLPFFIHLYLQNRFPFLLTSKDFCLVQNIHALILWERWGLNISSFLPFFFFSTFSIQSHFFSLHF